MDEQAPSRTAFAAAAHRAAHQVLEGGRIFADPLALAILGHDAVSVAEDAKAHPARRRMRFFIAARSHFAETAVESGVNLRGVLQVVALGAGLDTFAYRHPYGDRIRVFEVDHPATQAWKRRRLAEARIAVPESLTFAPADFERVKLVAALEAGGLDSTKRTLFLWLGVVPYLSEAAIASTLREIAGLAGGAEVVFDYSDPPATLSPEAQAAHAVRAARVAALNEPWLSYFEPADLAATLRSAGFVQIVDLGPPELAVRYWPNAAGAAPERGGHVVFAATSSAGASAARRG
jgi:methyltransferase (TIGR00027 family)